MTFISYAQNYEDVTLWRALKHVDEGFYIDVGAGDPQIFSVTRAFYDRGWHGINIEPIQEQHALLLASRKRDTNINALIGDSPGIARFYEFSSLGLSTMNPSVAQRHIAAGIEHRELTLPILSLASVCEGRGTQPIHFLKIDVEGAEREVLRSMDFSRFRPWIVVVEATEPMSQTPTRNEWEYIVTENGYQFAHFDGLNCYYVAEEHNELRDNLSLPPNVFDTFIRIEYKELQEQAEEWRLQLLRATETADTALQKIGHLEDKIISLKRDIDEAENALVEDKKILALEAGNRARLEEKYLSLTAMLEQSQQETLAERRLVLAEQKRLALEEENRATLEHKYLQLLAKFEQVERSFQDSQLDNATLSNRVAELEQALRAVFSSFSWRVTAPIRKTSQRFPAFARFLRSFLARHPRFKRLLITIARRLMRSPSPGLTIVADSTQPSMSSVVLPQQPPETGPLLSSDRRQKHWMFLGDTIDWLETGRQLSGVGKVTTELFFAADNDFVGDHWLPCSVAPTATGLGAISIQDTRTYLLKRNGMGQQQIVEQVPGSSNEPPAPTSAPMSGDHILFTGVVWTEYYIELFRSLAHAGVRFSVLVYDIIPIVNPEFVGANTSTTFKNWLRTVLIHAECVFVSSPSIGNQILRWAALSNIYSSAAIVPIKFGTNKPLLNGPALANALRLRVRSEFVLSVGTIDTRKNQILLCRIWPRLIEKFGRQSVPQLVLVGRDDLDLENYGPAKLAFQNEDIVVLQGVSDSDLAALYRTCQFTVFPSLSEGYGLPVAESLAYGKLCVSSDLIVIKEHAGDLPWYFNASDEEQAYQVLRRAIFENSARAEAEAEISANYVHQSWSSTCRAIAHQVTEMEKLPHISKLEQISAPVIPGVNNPPILPTIRNAGLWCTENNPDVSIIIINWNAAPLTRACIQNIWANTEGVSYEVIIADNGSASWETRALNTLGSGIKVLSLGTNRYFGEACNIAAEHARGHMLCLLNNDCFANPGWLRTLVSELQNNPEVGAVGPLFLFPDQTIQEAGGTINEGGYPVRHGRGDLIYDGKKADYLVGRSVDYISAAALVLKRDTYWRAGGFDLCYEPAYYEDADLCFKIQALGLSVQFCPEARVMHIEGASANDNPSAEARRKALGDINRAKFVSRWGSFLKSRLPTDLGKAASKVFIDVPEPVAVDRNKKAVLYTPYALTPGGGERFLLTIASLLLETHEVTVVTPNPYSRLRLLNLGFEFNLQLSGCRLQTEAEFLADPAPDLMVAVGNHIIPPIQPRTENSFFICQFPFPIGADAASKLSKWTCSYRSVIAYSDYAKAHIIAALSAYQMPQWPVEVVYPAVPQLSGKAAAKRPIILTVGRFFAGGHSKRHDLMIQAFRKLSATFDGDLEMHLVGSSTPGSEHMKYLDDLIRMADGSNVTFHINASQATLANLCRDAVVYWHATGLGADLAQDPAVAEHFGISLVEAMSAECVPLAFNAGGPREIVQHGSTGYLYNSVDELVELTRRVLRKEDREQRIAMGEAAGRRARDFDVELFRKRIHNIMLIDDQAESSPSTDS